jgi:hypothetical protein
MVCLALSKSALELLLLFWFGLPCFHIFGEVGYYERRCLLVDAS